MPPPDQAKHGALRLRIVSALVLAPLPLLAIWSGPVGIGLLAALAAGLMGWEWGRLCGRGALGRVGVALVAAAGGGVLSALPLGAPAAVVIVAAAAAALVAAAHAEGRSEPLLAGVGLLWIAVPCIALVWLAEDRVTGRSTLLWILALVWSTDIGAYAFGRTFGGPLLAPRWSPRKTWAGLAGGVLCAALAGWATAALLDLGPLRLAAVSAALAIVEQFGDLAESVAKRKFGVKDSSGLIPGHGGVFDRLDGLLAVVPAVALLTIVAGHGVLARP